MHRQRVADLDDVAMYAHKVGLHPACCRDPECNLPYVEHLRGVAVSADATPNRRPAVVAENQREARWHQDHAAYRSLRKGGYQPDHIDGSRHLERAL